MEDNNQKNNQPESSTIGMEPMTTTGNNNVIPEVTPVSPEGEVSSMPIMVEETPKVVEVSPAAATMSSAPVVEEVKMSEPMPEATTPAAEIAPNMRKRMVVQYATATLIVLIMGVGLTYALEKQGRIHTGIFAKINELMHPIPSVATVNGVNIPMTDYVKNLNQLTAAEQQQGSDVASDTVKAKLKKQALDVLVNTELLKQAAKKAGIVVTPDQIAARRKEIVTQVGDESKLQAKMKELGITDESLAKDIGGEILIQTFLKTAVDTSKVTVSDDEINAAYAQISASQKSGNVPPLAQIKTQLQTQLMNNKQQDLINKYIDTLHTGADIKILI